MISNLASQIWLLIKVALEAISRGNSIFASSFCSVLLALLTWRVWYFSISPRLHPDEPKYLPYWIPFVGHTVAFFKDVNGLISDARKYFHDSREPFILNILGEKLVILTSPDDLSEVYRNTSTLTFDGLVRTIHKGVANVSPEGFKTLWRTPAEGYEPLHPNPMGKVLVHYGNDIQHAQLLPGQRLEDLTHSFLRLIQENMRWNHFRETSVLKSNADEKVVSLHHWCLEVLVDSATRAFFGEYLLELEPSLTQTFKAWDENSWMMTYQYPLFLAKAAVQPRDRLINALTQYFEAPQEKRKGEVYLVRELEDEQRHAGLSNSDSARIFMIIYWAINTNAHKSTFWLMAHILAQPSLLASICTEIANAVAPIDEKSAPASSQLKIDHRYLTDSCPHLNAAFDEVLRVTSTSSNVREVLSPTRIGGKIVQPGMKLFISHRQLLLDKEGFGPTSEDMNPLRFLDDKHLSRSKFYRPFGGGTTLCSGRFVARREVLAFVAIALWRFDMETLKVGEEALGVNGKPFPRLNQGKPSLGIAEPMEGDDVVIKVKERSIG